jgi:triosephosphate isomerase
MSRKVVAGNWKMNKNWTDAVQLVEQLNSLCETFPEDVKVIIAPPAPYLKSIQDLSDDRIEVAAQNCSEHDFGAFTGEFNTDILVSIGVKYCIVGHSERRAMYGDTDEVVAAKVKACLNAGITPIFCCGEELEIREQNQHESHVRNQLSAVLELSGEELSRVIIAYEPVWAIGTGKTATEDQAREMHNFIRESIRADFGVLADLIPILYGGSCKPSNAEALFSQEDVDGGLIGGASLKAEDFNAIIQANG